MVDFLLICILLIPISMCLHDAGIFWKVIAWIVGSCLTIFLILFYLLFLIGEKGWRH